MMRMRPSKSRSCLKNLSLVFGVSEIFRIFDRFLKAFLMLKTIKITAYLNVKERDRF